MDAYRARMNTPCDENDGHPTGWFTPGQGEIYMQHAKRIPRGGTLVELGAYLGRSLSFIMPIAIDRDLRVVAIDAWIESPREQFEQNMQDFGWLDRITVIQGDTAEAAQCFKHVSVDLVLVDADHDYDGVMRDIDAWWIKVTCGGVMLGHDYTDYHYGVRQAVDEFFGDWIPVRQKIWRKAK